jgi:hypothetical protein
MMAALGVVGMANARQLKHHPLGRPTMDTEAIIQEAGLLRARIRHYARQDTNADYGEAAKAQTCEFLRSYAGPKSAFLKQAEGAAGSSIYMVSPWMQSWPHLRSTSKLVWQPEYRPSGERN